MLRYNEMDQIKPNKYTINNQTLLISIKLTFKADINSVKQLECIYCHFEDCRQNNRNVSIINSVNFFGCLMAIIIFNCCSPARWDRNLYKLIVI